MKKRSIFIGLALAFVVGLAGCGNSKKEAAKETTVKLGVIGSNTDVWDDVKKRLKDDDINLEYVKFTDYSQPNTALENGDIDLNSFQHQIFLDNFNEEHKTDLVSIGNTVSAPLGIYSEKIKALKDLKDGAKVAIPNDVTNGGRALKLLQTAKLITVKEGVTNPTVSDVTANPKKLKITELDASQTARAMKDVDISVINSGMAVDAGLIPQDDAIFIEPVDKTSKPYVNIIVARKKDADNKVYQKIVTEYQTEQTKKVIKNTSKGADIPAWEKFGKK